MYPRLIDKRALIEEKKRLSELSQKLIRRLLKLILYIFFVFIITQYATLVSESKKI